MATAEVLVPVDEVSAEVGSHGAADYWLRHVGAKIRQDWAGRPCVTPEDAQKAVQSYKQTMAEHAALQSAYDAYLSNRLQQLREHRGAAFEQAAIKAHADERQGLLDSETTFYVGTPPALSGRSHRIAQAAADAATEEFNRRNPVRTFEEFEREWRKKRR